MCCCPEGEFACSNGQSCALIAMPDGVVRPPEGEGQGDRGGGGGGVCLPAATAGAVHALRCQTGCGRRSQWHYVRRSGGNVGAARGLRTPSVGRGGKEKLTASIGVLWRGEGGGCSTPRAFRAPLPTLTP